MSTISTHTENNSKKINEFWKEQKKTGKYPSFLTDAVTIFDLNTHETKLNCFKKRMYIENVIQRNIVMKGLVELLWPDDINYIFDLKLIDKDRPLIQIQSHF
jgi:hypothetical protein